MRAAPVSRTFAGKSGSRRKGRREAGPFLHLLALENERSEAEAASMRTSKQGDEYPRDVIINYRLPNNLRSQGEDWFAVGLGEIHRDKSTWPQLADFNLEHALEGRDLIGHVDRAMLIRSDRKGHEVFRSAEALIELLAPVLESFVVEAFVVVLAGFVMANVRVPPRVIPTEDDIHAARTPTDDMGKKEIGAVAYCDSV